MSTREQTEIERKYDVRDEAVVPDLTGVRRAGPGAEAGGDPQGDGRGRGGAGPVLEVARVDRAAPAHLRAVYHDTDDHLLLRSRVTLRRRTGGHDEGWHLKLPPTGPAGSSGQQTPSGDPGTTGTDHSTAAAGGRREVHAPLGVEGSGVPAELLDRVRDLLGGRPVSPVVVLETTRTATTLVGADGSELVEVADDVVTATVSRAPASGAPTSSGGEPVVRRWREWEAELAPGVDGASGEALLDAVEVRLLDAGAVPSASRSKLARALGAEPA